MDPNIPRKRRRLSPPAANSRDIIDLTGDSPEPEPHPPARANRPPNHNMSRYHAGDEAFARQLQAQFDNENEEIIMPPAGSSSAPFATKPPTPPDDGDLRDDEAFARRLQAQWDAESGDEGVDDQPVPSQARSTSNFTVSNIDPSNKESYLQAEEVQAMIREFVEPIVKLKCPCKKPLLKSESDIHQFAQKVLDGTDRPSHLSCTIICRSCGRICNHEQARLVMIWAILCFFDDKSKHNKPDKKRKSTSIPPRPFAGSSGTGYGGHHREAYSHRPSRYNDISFAPKKQTALDEDDIMASKVMSCLAQLLPNYEGDIVFDPPVKQLQSLLLGSFILERVAELLRNNDLENVTSRAPLYVAMVKFVQTLSSHPSTSSLTFGDRVMRSPGASILKVSLGKTKLIESKDSDTTQPLSVCMKELAAQSEYVLKAEDMHADPGEVQLFRTTVELNEFVIANAGAEKSVSTVAKTAWHKKLAIDEVVDELITSTHSLISQSNFASNVPGRMKRIMRELARLKTSLPDGIFVRHCSSRPDIMKILIVGPEGTPYENGLFEFDLLCPEDFPARPPVMSFRTTGGGRVSFNPNLYPDGKVCLSLLGTWSGEPWNPSQSTLLQVAVSIQAMIFCEKPWENEPGRENLPNADQSNKTYNKSLYPRTIETAMIDWLEKRTNSPTSTLSHYGGYGGSAASTSSSCGIWEEIVKKHFDSNASDIVKTVDRWVTEPVSTISMHGLVPGSYQMTSPWPQATKYPSAMGHPTNHPAFSFGGAGHSLSTPATSPGFGSLGSIPTSGFALPPQYPPYGGHGHTLGGSVGGASASPFSVPKAAASVPVARPLAGTGWQGRSLNSGSTSSSVTDQKGLVQKLRGALDALQKQMIPSIY